MPKQEKENLLCKIQEIKKLLFFRSTKDHRNSQIKANIGEFTKFQTAFDQILLYMIACYRDFQQISVFYWHKFSFLN